MRLVPIDRDIELVFREDLSAAARSKIFAEFAQEQIDEASKINKQALGRVPPYDVAVDGRQGAPLSSVKPDGMVFVEYQLQSGALSWIMEQLQRYSPVRSGLYAKSHELFADGVAVENPNDPPPAEEYVFINIQPYARKIEKGSSSQAPDGVYQAVAALAARKFGNSEKISFGYRSLTGLSPVGNWAATTMSGRHIRNSSRRAEWLTRQPAIIVRSR